MFWNYNQSSSPQIDNVFCKEDLTLQDILDQENILQELKIQNKKLIDFLIKPDVLSELVSLITTEPEEDIPEKERYRHPNMACELLTTDIPSLTENLAKDSNLLSKLYSFLEADPPLNPLLASFFSRTMGILVVRKSEQNWYSYQFTCLQVLELLKSKQTSVSLLLKHLSTSAIMDLTLKLVTQVEGTDMRKNMLDFMAAQGLVENLVDLLSPSASAAINANAALLLCDIIVKSREAQLTCENKSEPDPILSSLESTETIKKILEIMFGDEKKESSLIGGISVLLTLLEPPKLVGGGNPDPGVIPINYGSLDGGGGGASGDSPAPSPPPTVAQVTAETIIPFMPAFHDLLLNPPKKPGVRLTCYTVDPPLGNTRLHVVRLLVALISTHHPLVAQQLVALDTVNVLLNLFFSYSWNNFLHTQVEKCLNAAMAVDPSPSENPVDNLLIHNIFVTCRLLNKIVEAWKQNKEDQSKPGGFRKGYMGHLTRLSATINTQMEKNLRSFLNIHLSEEELTSWDELTNGPLREIQFLLETCLGGKHPGQSTSEDDEKNFRNIPFQQDAQLQQLYSEYQTQQMAPQFIENFGYHESEFNDPEDNMNPVVDRLAHLSFSVTDDEEMERQEEMFKQVCAQKLQCLEEEDDDQVWSDHNISSRVWNGGEEIANYNSSDDEERPGPEGREEAHMEVNQADPWLSLTNSGPGMAPVAVGAVNPWGDGATDSVTDNEGWANFGSATAFTFDGSTNTMEPPPDLPADIFPTPSPIPATTSCPNSNLTHTTTPISPTPSPTTHTPSPITHTPTPITHTPNPVTHTPNLTTEQEPTSDTDVISESRSEPLGASSLEEKEDDSPKNGNNANPSCTSPVKTTTLEEQQLIDNFRFLSSQGLISDNSESSNTSSPSENSSAQSQENAAGQSDPVEEVTPVEESVVSKPPTPPSEPV